MPVVLLQDPEHGHKQLWLGGQKGRLQVGPLAQHKGSSQRSLQGPCAVNGQHLGSCHAGQRCDHLRRHAAWHHYRYTHIMIGNGALAALRNVELNRVALSMFWTICRTHKCG